MIANRYYVPLAAALSLALAAACSKPAEPAALVPADYGSWRTTTDLRLDYPIPGHEDRFRVIRMNDKGFELERTPGSPERFTFPEGTVIAKDIYATNAPGPTDAPVMVTAMIKAPSDARSRGGWLWVVKDTKTQAETVISSDYCLRCHDNANERHAYGWKNPAGAFADYTFFPPGTPTSLSPASESP